MKKSIYEPNQAIRTVDMKIDSLSVDGNNTKEILMFRLAENITTILVHQKVKDEIDKSGIKLVRFFDPESYAAL